jgi:hypothetical protein
MITIQAVELSDASPTLPGILRFNGSDDIVESSTFLVRNAGALFSKALVGT